MIKQYYKSTTIILKAEIFYDKCVKIFIMIGEVKKYKRFFVSAVFLLSFSFLLNIFGAVSTGSFVSSYKDSESLVSNQIKCDGKIYANQLLEIKSQYAANGTMKGCQENILVPYSSHFGLQGKIYTVGFDVLSAITNKSISPAAYIVLAQITTAIISAIVLGLFVLWVRSQFGFVPALVSIVLVAVSPMIVGFSRNLYWVLPTFILPLIFILFYYPQKNADKNKRLLFWIILGALLCIRFLCGYEYLTTITIMTFSVIVYYLFVNKAKKNEYIREIIIAGVVSVLAFFSAIAIHVWSLNSYTGSTEKSIGIIMQRAKERTISPEKYLKYPYMNLEWMAGDYYKTTDSYLNYPDRIEGGSLKWSLFAALSNYALLSVVNLPFITSPFALYTQSMAAFIIYLLLLYLNRKKWTDRKEQRNLTGLYLAFIVGLVGYISWLVLAFSHSLVHAHINGILMYLPSALFGYIIIGLYIDHIITKHFKGLKK